MKYGLNLLLWTDRMHDGMVPVVERVKSLGYDGVEMPIFELNEPLHRQWGQRLDALGLERTAVTVRNAGDNPISPSATVRAAAVDAMKKTKGVTIENAKGGRGRDVIIGNEVDNKLAGNDGDDKLVGKAGNDVIDGGGGRDIAYFAVTRDAASITVGKDAVTVQAGADGIDRLTGVERLAFQDRTLALDTGAGQNAGAVFRLYKMAFARAPDIDGMSYWIAALDEGRLTLRTVAQAFSQSGEFANRFGAEPTPSAMISDFYQTGLGRAGAPDDAAFWRNEVRAGFSMGDLLIAFSESSENVGNLAPLMGQGILIGVTASPV